MFLYIDPGTGSMLFTILIGLLGAGIYFLRGIAVKLKFFFSGGRQKADTEKVPLVIYSDHKRYWNIFEPICDECEKRGLKVTYYSSSPDDPAFNKTYTHIHTEFAGEGNKGFAKMNMIRANIVLSTTPGLDVYQWKRSKDVDYYVHIPHSAGNLTGYRMFGIDFYDAILVSADFQKEQVRELERRRKLPEKEIEMVGIPYMDRLLERYRTAGEKKSEETTVLVAPSWGPNSIFNRYGESFIDALIKTGYNVVLRPHPQSYTSEKELIERLKNRYPETDKLHWNSDNDNFEALRNSDIMISDFSGVMYEYLLVYGKPIIYTDISFDYAQFDQCWLDGDYWTVGIFPKIGMKLTEEMFPEMKEAIDECIHSEKYIEGRKQVIAEMWRYQGEGTNRTVDYLEKKYSELTDRNQEEN